MKFKNKLLIISMLLLSFSANLLAQTSQLGLRIKQGSAMYDILAQDSLVIKSKPFKYLVSFPTKQQITLHHAFSDSLYQEFRAGHVTKIPDWWAHCMAEESYNSDKELLVSSDSWSCWFYDEETSFHRLDAKSIRFRNGIYSGKKSINWLFDVDAGEKQTIRSNSKPIYLIVAEEGKTKDSIGYSHTCKIIFE